MRPDKNQTLPSSKHYMYFNISMIVKETPEKYIEILNKDLLYIAINMMYDVFHPFMLAKITKNDRYIVYIFTREDKGNIKRSFLYLGT